MRVGTKSVIFGVHSILVHPFFVAYAWSRLFGFPWDPRLWVGLPCPRRRLRRKSEHGGL